MRLSYHTSLFIIIRGEELDSFYTNARRARQGSTPLYVDGPKKKRIQSRFVRVESDLSRMRYLLGPPLAGQNM
jgi:hypothetical protein